MIALAAALLLQAEPAPVSAPMRAVPTAEAIATFRQVCVETMPDPARFARALGSETAWEPIERAPGDLPGNAWRSPRGVLAYRYLAAPGHARVPACFYGFRTDAGFSPADAAAQLARALGLGAGAGPWDTRLPNGARVHVALATGADGISGPAATLSISAFPVADAEN